MRILHVVSYVSRDGAFGGPVSVAVAQTQELAARGHEVQLWAGYDGSADLRIPGVQVRLFRTVRLGPGFSGLTAPMLERALRRRGQQFDVVHVHLARDLITTRVATWARKRRMRYFLQPHGMVMPDRRLRARVWDAFATRRSLVNATGVLALSEREELGVRAVATAPVNVIRVLNGLPGGAPTALGAEDAPQNDVLFLARLHPRKRVMAFAHAAALAHKRAPHLNFRVIGPDEGDLAELRRFIAEHPELPIRYEGPVSPGEAPGRLRQAGVYVLPSFGEVVPMTVLEALVTGVPVVMTDDCALAPLLAERGAALVTDGSPAQLCAAILRIFADPEVRTGMISSGLEVMRTELSIAGVVDRIQQEYLESASPGAH